MTNLDTLLQKAFSSEGETGDVNKVYLALINTELFLPTLKQETAPGPDEEPFTPLFSQEGKFIFMAVFDSLERLQDWAGEQYNDIEYVAIKGHDVIAGIGGEVHLALNPQTEFYKEFPPQEIQRIKAIVSRVNKFKEQAKKD